MRERRKVLLAAVAIVTAALGLLAQSTDTLRRPELASVDARFHIRGTSASPDVVVVGLDDYSLRQLNERPPIPRAEHARLLNALKRAGARAVAYDFEFAQATTPRDDEALFNAIERTGGMVVASTTSDRGESPVLGGPETQREIHAIPGTVNYDTDRSVIRRVKYDVFGLRMFPVATSELVLGHKLDRALFGGDGAWIDFRGGQHSIRQLRFVDVLRGKDAAELRGKVVIVGATAPIIQDYTSSSFGDGVPGAVINAAAVQTMLDGFPLRDGPGWLTTLLILVAAMATPLTALRLQGLRWLPVPALLAVALPIGAQLAFDGGKVVPFAVPATALIASFIGTLAVAYATDLLQRRRLKLAFSRFVPPAIVDEVVALAGDDLRLGGERREGTVLFADLRGFTSHAEHLTPEQVIELLNRYLTEMSDAILDNGGTVVSYMGDGIMAVFGAPIAQEDHADRALQAAREMLGPRLNAFTDWAGADLKMGIGLCSGPVMSGNVGSQRRLEYTAVGDTTNTASRLEAMTKDHSVPILVSDATRQALTSEQPLRDMGELPIRGREQTLRCWTFV